MNNSIRFSLMLLCPFVVDTTMVHASEQKKFHHMFKKIEIQTDCANIRFTKAKSETITNAHTTRVQYDPVENMDVSFKETDDSLKIHAKSNGLNSREKLSFTIETPPLDLINIDNGQGDISVKDIKTALTINQGQGSIFIDSPLTKTVIDLGQGTIKANQLDGDATLKMGQGDMDISYNTVPKRPINVEMNLVHGEAVLKLPAESKVSFKNISSFLVSFWSDFNAHPQGDFLLHSKIAVGKMSIKKNN